MVHICCFPFLLRKCAKSEALRILICRRIEVLLRCNCVYYLLYQIYGKDDRAMRRIWQRVRTFISKPKYEFRKHKKIDLEEEVTDDPLSGGTAITTQQ